MKNLKEEEKKKEKDTVKGIKMEGKSEKPHLLGRCGGTPDLNYVR